MNPDVPTITAEDLRQFYGHFARSLDQVMPETRATYVRSLREFARWHKSKKVVSLSVSDVKRYQKYLIEERRLAAASVSTYLTALRRFLGYLVERGALPQNPAVAVAGGPRPVSHSRGSLSPSEVKAMIAVINPDHFLGCRDLAIVYLMLGCGLSEIEIVRANVGDLMASGGHTLRVQGKGRRTKDAIVRMHAETYDAVARYLATRKSPRWEDPLFESAGNRTRGMRMTTRGIRDRVSRYLDLAGIVRGRRDRISPYSLRHTAGIMLAEAGATADEIQHQMRLGTPATATLYLKKPPSNTQQ